MNEARVVVPWCMVVKTCIQRHLCDLRVRRRVLQLCLELARLLSNFWPLCPASYVQEKMNREAEEKKKAANSNKGSIDEPTKPARRDDFPEIKV